MEVETEGGPPLILFGRHPVLEALRGEAGRVEEVLVEAEGGGRIGPVLALARRTGVRCSRVPRSALTALAGTTRHQGVVARLAARAYASLEVLLGIPRERNEAGLLLALDQVQDPGNVGNLLRSGEALGVHGAIVLRHHAAGLTAHAAKAAAGALEHLPVARVGNLVQTLEGLKREGYWVVGGVAAGAETVPPWALDLRGPVTLVLGSEGQGLRPLVARTCDALTRIPLAGRVASLNVAAAGAILLYEARRQRAGRREPAAGASPGVGGQEKDVDRGRVGT